MQPPGRGGRPSAPLESQARPPCKGERAGADWAVWAAQFAAGRQRAASAAPWAAAGALARPEQQWARRERSASARRPWVKQTGCGSQIRSKSRLRCAVPCCAAPAAHLMGSARCVIAAQMCAISSGTNGASAPGPCGAARRAREPAHHAQPACLLCAALLAQAAPCCRRWPDPAVRRPQRLPLSPPTLGARAPLTSAGSSVPDSSVLSAARTAASPSVMRSAAASMMRVACRRSSSAHAGREGLVSDCVQPLRAHPMAVSSEAQLRRCGTPDGAACAAAKQRRQSRPADLGARPAAPPGPAAHPCARARYSGHTAPAAPAAAATAVWSGMAPGPQTCSCAPQGTQPQGPAPSPGRRLLRQCSTHAGACTVP